jgi:hypothetical protein
MADAAVAAATMVTVVTAASPKRIFIVSARGRKARGDWRTLGGQATQLTQVRTTTAVAAAAAGWTKTDP